MKIVVTGANGGLGLAVIQELLSRHHKVVGTVRSAHHAEYVARKVGRQYTPQLECVLWDAQQAEDRSDQFESHLRSCDVLINNAGWEADLSLTRDPALDTSVFDVSDSIFKKAFQINMHAPRQLMAVCVPKMQERGFGRVVNVASALGAMKNRVGEANAPSYRLSKHALIALTLEAAYENHHPGVCINAVCPGWCQTRMGGPLAPQSVHQGVENILAAVFETHKSGQFWCNGTWSDI